MDRHFLFVVVVVNIIISIILKATWIIICVTNVFFEETSKWLELNSSGLVLSHLTLLKRSEYFWIWRMSIYVLITKISIYRIDLGLLTSKFMPPCCMIIIYEVPRKIMNVIQTSLVYSPGMSNLCSISILVTDQSIHCLIISTKEKISCLACLVYPW